MDAAWLQAIPVWVQAHPFASLSLVFAAALLESLFLFGLLVPGALLMFLAGILIGTGALPLWPTIAAAMAGAIAGDSASYLLGLYSRKHPWLRRQPRMAGLLARGEDFFAAHGGKSIILGRFVGPLRPVIPTIAGAAGMSPGYFLIVDVAAAFGWAPIYLLPGAVFGASLEIAAQVATRLTVLLLITLTSLWLLIWISQGLLRAGAAWGRSHARDLLAWSRRHRRLGLLGPALADPRQPELPALAVTAGALLILAWTLYAAVWGLDASNPPPRPDAFVHGVLLQLHTYWSDYAARMLAQLGSPGVYLPLTAAVTAVLMLLGNYRAAAHWLVAVAFAGILALGLVFMGSDGDHLILAATVYGFLAVILAVRHPAWRQIYYGIATGLVGAIALARLYLGLAWLSDIVIGLSVACLWLALLGQGYRRQRPQVVRNRPILAILGLIVAVAAVWQFEYPTETGTAPAGPVERIEAWWDGGYRQLPALVEDLAGRRREPLNIQAAGDLAAVEKSLDKAGWRPTPALTPKRALLWLQPDAPLDSLPLLPRMHDGRAPALTRIHTTEDGNQFELRLWPTARIRAEDGAPLWVGRAARLDVSRRLPLLRLPGEASGYDDARARLLAAPTATPRALRERAGETVLLWDATADSR